jgi:ABC-type dipeptide/oligopeptide/nickel transport system permease component
MLNYFLRRVVGTVPVIFMISLFVFLLLQSAPGDPADLLIPDQASAEDIADARRRWGLDQPVLVQYWRFLVSAVSLDFGRSFKYDEPVLALIMQRFPATLELAMIATILAIVIGIPLGIFASSRPNSWFDNASSLGGFFGVSMPNFWMAIMLILIVSGYFNLLPSGGRSTFGVAEDPITGFLLLDSILQRDWTAFADAVKYLVLPAIVLSVNMAGLLMRMTRSSMLEVLSEDYIMTARAKGLSERVVVWRHALKNARIMVITVVGLEFGALISGSIIVEAVFSWPGIGQLLLQGITARDYPLITGLVLVYTTLFIIVNLIVDFLYAAADPRIRLGG